MQNLLLPLSSLLYERLARPFIFRGSAQDAHTRTMVLLEWLDRYRLASMAMGGLRRLTLKSASIEVGEVTLPSPLILAAGFVKGHGFADEVTALDAVRRGDNIMPGWRTMSRLVGPVEFGSFTRWPRRGNPGTVMWRERETRSTQNRVGLKNPGMVAAAEFLAGHRSQLPACYGINIAVSPGVDDPTTERQEVLESIATFIGHGVYPSWFTLNLSCPNTDDDPTGNQTDDKARRLCSAIVDYLCNISGALEREIPLWVKIGPNLNDQQYGRLMAAFAAVGVKAVVATNTMPAPAPDNSSVMAGVGGGALYKQSLRVATKLMQLKHENDYAVDVVACGGIMDGPTYRAYRDLGVVAMQYWSALVYRGPLAAAHILQEGS